jgi:hypothetical protein
MIKSALKDDNEDLLHDLLLLFIGDQTPTSPSTVDVSGLKTIKLDPIEVYKFLNNINQDFAIKYMESICFKSELGTKQRDIHNRIVYAYCDRLKQLFTELKELIKTKQNEQQTIYQGMINRNKIILMRS